MNVAASTPSSLPATRSVRNRMGWLLAVLLPAIAMRVRVSGSDLLFQIAVALAFALLVEAMLLRLRGQSWVFLLDGSAAVTALLFAVCLPQTTAWWIVAFGLFAALALGKHVYGGLGRNPFNPAMLGVALVLVCFPATLATGQAGIHSLSNQEWMAIASADAFGGMLLLWLQVVRWQIPLAVLAGAAFCDVALLLGGAAIAPHDLLAGNLMLAAFFIATDPASGSTTRRGRWLFGLGTGCWMVILMRFGAGAGSLPFAILLMNCAAPWIDQSTQPRRLAESRHG